MATVLALLIPSSNALHTNYAPPRGTPVLLSHRCTQNELSHRGDGPIFLVRLQSDHSSLVNQNVMPVEDDLRREIKRLMSAHWEQVLYFAADDNLSYQEVSDVLSDLLSDEPALNIVALTNTQTGPPKQLLWTNFRDFCLNAPIPAGCVSNGLPTRCDAIPTSP